MRPRFFSRRLDRRRARIYRGAAIWFALVAAGMVWPGYVPFARARPLVLGVPAGLAWLAALMGVSFAIAWALFVWESRQGWIDADDQPGPD